MRIRPATAADVAALVKLGRHFLAGTLYGVILQSSPDEEEAGMALEALLSTVLEQGVILVAEARVEGEDRAWIEILGGIALTVQPNPITGKLFADEVAWWVEPDYRKGTIGPRLLAAAAEWACSKGCTVLRMVAPKGTEVGRFYEKLGFTEVETTWSRALT